MHYAKHQNEMVVEDLQNIVSEAKVKFASRKALFLAGGAIALAVLLIVFLLMGIIMLGSRDCGGSAAMTAALTGGKTKKVCIEPSCLRSAAFVAENRDVSIDPCQDFYKYACKGWQDKTPLPPTAGSSSILDQLAVDNEQKWRSMLESPIASTGAPTSERKLKDFFSHCLHDYGRNDDGADLVEAIKTYVGGWYGLDTLSWKTHWNLDRAVANIHIEFLVGVLFDFDIWPDSTGVRNNIMVVMPEPLSIYAYDFTDPNRRHIKDAYKKYIKTVGGLLLRDANLTMTRAEKESRLLTFVNDVMDHSQRIAEFHEDSDYVSQRVTLGELARNFTEIHWVQILSSVFNHAGISSSTTVLATKPAYFRVLNDALKNEGANRDRILNNYMVWRIVHTYTYVLSWEYRNARYDYIRTRTGYTDFPSTWENCMWVTKNRMGFAMAALFVHKHIEEGAPQEVEKMVGDMRSSAVKRVDGFTWMDDQTKANGKYKLNNMDMMVGFPKVIESADRLEALYDQLKVNTSVSFFKNIIYSNEFTRYLLSHELTEDYKDSMWRYSVLHQGLGVKPVYYWYYNTMMVPPGSMVFPMYSNKLSPAMVYGGMGHFVGERMVHSFDLIGRHVINGTYNMWWSDSTKTGFDNATQCLTDFYQGRKAGPYNVNGESKMIEMDGTMGKLRAIAKTYGLQIAFQSYQDNGFTLEQQLLPGLNLTKEQLFFVASAQLQCSKKNDIESYYMAMSGIMPDDMLVNGVVGQNPDFHKAFQCPDNSPMKPKTFCSLV